MPKFFFNLAALFYAGFHLGCRLKVLGVIILHWLTGLCYSYRELPQNNKLSRTMKRVENITLTFSGSFSTFPFSIYSPGLERGRKIRNKWFDIKIALNLNWLRVTHHSTSFFLSFYPKLNALGRVCLFVCHVLVLQIFCRWKLFAGARWMDDPNNSLLAFNFNLIDRHYCPKKNVRQIFLLFF